MIAEILLIMGALLLLAKIFGEIAERIGLAPLVGEIAAGVLLGPVLGIVVIHSGSFMSDFMNIGIILLLFIAGLGIKFEDIKDNIYSASMLAVAGGLLTVVLGIVAGIILFNNFLIGLVIGIILLSTSDAIVFGILMKIGEFKTRTGRMVVSMTMADDIAGILALSFLIVFVTNSTIPVNDMFRLFLISIGFYLVILTVGTRISNKIVNMSGNFIGKHALFAVPLAIMFLLAVVSENIGLGIATGAFLAGMMLAKTRFTESVLAPNVKIIGDGFVIPLFYASVGTFLSFSGFNLVLVVVLLLISFAGKYIGSGMLGRFFGYRSDDIKLMGLSMVPRGDYNIAVAQIALIMGVISTEIYTSVIFAIILTIVLAPILIAATMGKKA
ncbi:MAG: cation:proton antiporter, partial [Candidatus Aenigmatarchaeota archaeon]